MRRGVVDQGSAAVERLRRGSGHGSDGRLCAGSQDSSGTGCSANSGEGVKENWGGGGGGGGERMTFYKAVRQLKRP